MNKKLILFMILSKMLFASKEIISIDELVIKGLEYNKLITIKEKEIDIRSIELEILNSNIKPNILLDFSYDIYQNENILGNPWINDSTLSNDKLSSNIILKQSVFDGGIFKNNKLIKKTEKDIEILKLEGEIQSTIYEVMYLYYEFLKENDTLNLKKKVMEKLEFDKKNIHILSTNKMVLDIEILKIDIEILKIKQEITLIENNITKISNEINKLTGISLKKFDLLEPKLSNGSNIPNLDTIIKKSYINNLEMQILLKNQEKLIYEDKLSNSENKPAISFQASYGYEFGNNEKFDNWKISFNIKQNIYNGNKTKNIRKSIATEKEKLELLEIEIKEKINNSVKELYDNLQGLDLIIDTNKKIVQYYIFLSEKEEIKYKNQIININELISIRLDLMTSEQNHIKSIYEYEQLILKLNKMTGEIMRFGGNYEN